MLSFARGWVDKATSSPPPSPSSKFVVPKNVTKDTSKLFGAKTHHDADDTKHASRPWDNFDGHNAQSRGEGLKKGMGGDGESWGDLKDGEVSVIGSSFVSGVDDRGGYDGAGESLVGGSDEEGLVDDDGDVRGGGGYEERVKRSREMSKRFSKGEILRRNKSKVGVSAGIVVGPKVTVKVDAKPWPKAPFIGEGGRMIDGDDEVENRRWSARVSRQSMRVPPAVSLMKTTSFMEYDEDGNGVGKVEEVDVDVDLSAVSDSVSYVDSVSEGGEGGGNRRGSLNGSSVSAGSGERSSSSVEEDSGNDRGSFGTLDSFGSTALDNDIKFVANNKGKRESRIRSELPEFPDLTFKEFVKEENGKANNSKDRPRKRNSGNRKRVGGGGSGDEEDPLDIPERLSRNPSTMKALVDLQRASARVGDELLRSSNDPVAGVRDARFAGGVPLPMSNNAARISRAQGELHLRGRFFRRWNHRYASVVDHAFFGAVLFLFKHDARGLRSGKTALKNSSMIILADSRVSIADGKRKDMDNVLFQLYTAKRKYLFAAPDPKKREYWIDHLTMLTDKYPALG